MKTTRARFLNSKKKFWIVYHFGLLIISALVAMVMKYQQHGNAFEPTVIVPFVTIFLMSACIGYLAIFMVNKAKGYTKSQLNKKIIPALLIFYAASFLIANVSISLGVLGWFVLQGRNLSEFFPHLLKYELSFGNGRLFVWLMFFTIAFFYVLWQKGARLEQAIREENLKYRYRNLKSQLNPHFLFNSLNTLSEIVYTDAPAADRYIQQLSGIYRYILDHEETDFVSLRDELEFVRNYFDLQKERDNDTISLNVDIQTPDAFKIIPVSLQLLVENALKHNARSAENPLVIQIYLSADFIVVENPVQRKNTIDSPSHTGLSNLKERVSLIMDKEMVFYEENNNFVVKLPVIRV